MKKNPLWGDTRPDPIVLTPTTIEAMLDACTTKRDADTAIRMALEDDSTTIEEVATMPTFEITVSVDIMVDICRRIQKLEGERP